MATIFTVNHRGSDEYSLHVIGDGEPRVIAIFHKCDKATNRRRAILQAREIAQLSGYQYDAAHNLSAREFDHFLPANAQ